ncbi:MAG: twin-arginine translocase TatA/TatE family subunit [Endomicrobia bacterium]|nr:twin-arginine translocase TatA/TatE family subunit [Endomicrobiia bacterium]MCL2506259.1 twin-arginine translocase TatA/TatE family subunit [Endomicrobiia bacterium]
MSLGMGEILLIVIAVVVLFGGKKIPELAKALAKASYEFKKAKDAIANEANELKKASEIEVKELEKSVTSDSADKKE